MEQVAAKTKAGQASPAGTFSMKLGKTTYVVGVHFSQTAKDTLEDKMKRLMKDDVKDSMPQEVRKEMETQLKSIIQQYMQRMNNNELVYRE